MTILTPAIGASADCDPVEQSATSEEIEQLPGGASIEPIPDRETILRLIEAEERERYGVWPMLPHESEADFKILRSELSHEFTWHQFGFGRYIAHEAVISRVNINRLRQALRANGDLRRAAGRPENSAASELDWRLEHHLDLETSCFQEDLALVDKFRQADASRSAMVQQLNLVTATTPNPTHRPLAHKVSPSEHRQDELERERFKRRKYIDRDNKLTNYAKANLALSREHEGPYISLLVAAMDCCGFEKLQDVLSARDIADDTWHIRDFLCEREEVISVTYAEEAIRVYRDRTNTTGCEVKSPTELYPLTSALFESDVLDPNPILLATLSSCLDKLDAVARKIASARARRKRTIEWAMKHRASRLRISITQARGWKSESIAEWALLKSQL